MVRDKKEALKTLNDVFKSDFVGDLQRVLNESTIGIIKSKWDSPEIQKSIANKAFGIKGKNFLPGPKRNRSAFMFFCQEKRREMAEEFSSRKPNDCMVILGKMWSEVDSLQKEKFEQMAQEDRERYVTDKQKTKISTHSAKKSSYILFCQDERGNVKEAFPHMKTKEITAELGKRWNELKLNNPDKYKEYVIRSQNYMFEAPTSETSIQLCSDIPKAEASTVEAPVHQEKEKEKKKKNKKR